MGTRPDSQGELGWTKDPPLLVLRLAVLVGFGWWSWWESGTRTFTWQAELATAPAVAILLASASWKWFAQARSRSEEAVGISPRAGKGQAQADALLEKGADGQSRVFSHGQRALPRTRIGSRLYRAGLAAWAVAIGGAGALELTEYFSSPRSLHPTISVLGNSLIDLSRPIHAAMFGAWLLIGWWLCW